MKLQRRSSFGWPVTAADYAPCANGTVVHYNDKPPMHFADKPHSACVSHWKWTRKFHMGPERGWKDIGYSFAVCAHGIVMEGRGWRHEQAAQPGGNITWTSVTFLSGEGEKPTDVQIKAYRELRSWLRTKGMAAGERPHRAFVSTTCPGTVLAKMVKDGSLRGASGSDKTDNWQEAMMQKLPTLQKGATGEHVQSVQALLGARSHPVKMDGVFGDATETAVKALQKWGKVKADGVVGANTWPVLLRV